MAKLQEMGEFVRSASSTIEAPVVRRLKDEFGGQAAKAGGDGAARKAPSAARRSANGTAARGPGGARAPGRERAGARRCRSRRLSSGPQSSPPHRSRGPRTAGTGRSAARSGCHRAVPGRPERRAAAAAGRDHAGQAGVRRSGRQVGTAACRGRPAPVGARVRPAAHPAARAAPRQQPVQLDCDRHGSHAAHSAGRALRPLRARPRPVRRPVPAARARPAGQVPARRRVPAARVLAVPGPARAACRRGR